MKITRTVAAAVVAAFAATTVAFAQGTTPMPKMSPMASPKPMMSTLYVCKMCKMGYTEAQAKTMKMKDPMGHALVKMAKLPAGYKMAPAKPMSGSKMSGSKMSGSKMSPMASPSPKM